MKLKSFLLASLITAIPAASQGAMVITEWMYSGTNGEFIEFTNTGATNIDMTGWSFDDDSRIADTVPLSAFGIVGAGQSVILTEATEAAFRTAWSLPGSVKVIGGLTTNLGRNDEINLFDATDTLADRLTFSDQNIAGSIRAQNISGFTAPANYGSNNALAWSLSVNGAGGAYASAGGDIGSPGIAAIPEPSAAILGAIGALALLRRRR